MDELKNKMAGEIVLAPNPGLAMKKWRELFKIPQMELANYLNISASTISDYESGRRKSPGIGVVKRFIDALLEIDKNKGGEIIKRFQQKSEGFFEAINFMQAVTADKFARLIKAKTVACTDALDRLIFGATIVDSLKVILDMPYENLIRIYSTTSQRALFFTGVETGRSPMVAVRVAPIKPAIVVIHSPKKVDPLAIRIAESEHIPLMQCNTRINKVREILKKL